MCAWNKEPSDREIGRDSILRRISRFEMRKENNFINQTEKKTINEWVVMKMINVWHELLNENERIKLLLSLLVSQTIFAPSLASMLIWSHSYLFALSLVCIHSFVSVVLLFVYAILYGDKESNFIFVQLKKYLLTYFS